MFGPRKMVVFPESFDFSGNKVVHRKTNKQTNDHVYNIVTLVPRRLRPSWTTRENPALEGCNATLLPLRDAEQQQRTGCIWYHTEPSSYIIIKKVHFIFRVRTFHMIAPHTAGCQHVTWILGAFTNERPVTARRRFVNTRCTWERSNTRQL